MPFIVHIRANGVSRKASESRLLMVLGWEVMLVVMLGN